MQSSSASVITRPGLSRGLWTSTVVLALLGIGIEQVSYWQLAGNVDADVG